MAPDITGYITDEIFRFGIGDFICYSIFDGYYEGGKASQLFSNAEPAILANELERYGLRHDDIFLPCSCLLVKSEEQVLLIDTGYGVFSKENPYAPNAGRLINNLSYLGIKPEQIDKVILTHCDGDHIGGTINEGGNPRFSNAQYMISQKEWSHWRTRYQSNSLNDEEKRFFLRYLFSVENQVNLVPDTCEILKGIKAILSPGHSPGHLIVEITSNGKGLIYLSDSICHSLHLKYPDWKMAFEHDPDLAIQSRLNILSRLSETQSIAHFFHLPFPAIGTADQADSGYRWNPINL